MKKINVDGRSVNIRKREGKKRTSYEYYIEVDSEDGQRKRISKSGFRTASDAKAAGRKALLEYNHPEEPKENKAILFKDALPSHILDLYSSGQIKATTAEGYMKLVNSYILTGTIVRKDKTYTKLNGSIEIENPIPQNITLNKLANEPRIINEFLTSFASLGYSKNTLLEVKTLLTRFFNSAEENGLIAKSPSPRIKMPKTNKNAVSSTEKPNEYIPPEIISSIFQEFPEGTIEHIPLMLGYKCGLRLGEAFALTWDCVDFEQKKIIINKQVQWDKNTGQWYFTRPKYGEERTIDIDSSLAELLQRTKASQQKHKADISETGQYKQYYEDEKRYVVLGTSNNCSEICFVNTEDDGTFVHSRKMQKASSIIHSKLKYKPFTFHSLRHTHASILCEKHLDLKYIQKRLGHKNTSVTLDIYIHVTENMNNEGKAQLEEIFSES